METLKKQQKINLEKYVHHESFSPLSTGAFQRPTLAARREERSASVTMTVLPRVVASLAVPGLILCFITLPFPAILSQRPPLPTEPSPTPAPHTRPECTRLEHPVISIQGEHWCLSQYMLSLLGYYINVSLLSRNLLQYMRWGSYFEILACQIKDFNEL